MIAGGVLIAGAFQLLRRSYTNDQLLTAVNNFVLPAGAKLIEIADGSVNLKVHAENLLALDDLWRMYKNGSLKARLQVLFVTDEMKEFVGGEQVELVVTIDEQEYIKARNELTAESKGKPTVTWHDTKYKNKLILVISTNFYFLLGCELSL